VDSTSKVVRIASSDQFASHASKLLHRRSPSEQSTTCGSDSEDTEGSPSPTPGLPRRATYSGDSEDTEGSPSPTPGLPRRATYSGDFEDRAESHSPTPGLTRRAKYGGDSEDAAESSTPGLPRRATYGSDSEDAPEAPFPAPNSSAIGCFAVGRILAGMFSLNRTPA